MAEVSETVLPLFYINRKIRWYSLKRLKYGKIIFEMEINILKLG